MALLSFRVCKAGQIMSRPLSTMQDPVLTLHISRSNLHTSQLPQLCQFTAQNRLGCGKVTKNAPPTPNANPTAASAPNARSASTAPRAATPTTTACSRAAATAAVMGSAEASRYATGARTSMTTVIGARSARRASIAEWRCRMMKSNMAIKSSRSRAARIRITICRRTPARKSQVFSGRRTTK